jgi:hypothetical protein
MEDQYAQESPQVRTTPYASPMHQYGSSILLLTNPENELYKMELTFRNMKLDRQGNPQTAGDPLMNESGISAVIGVIQSVVNQSTVMSNLSKGEVPIMMDFLGDTLAKDMMINRIPYGITSTTARDKIYFIALSSAFMTLKRAYEEGDKRFWKGSVQEISTRVEGAQKKGGIFSALNPWSKQ